MSIEELHVLVGSWRITGATPDAERDNISGEIICRSILDEQVMELTGTMRVDEMEIDTLEVIWQEPALDYLRAHVYSASCAPLDYRWVLTGGTTLLHASHIPWNDQRLWQKHCGTLAERSGTTNTSRIELRRNNAPHRLSATSFHLLGRIRQRRPMVRRTDLIGASSIFPTVPPTRFDVGCDGPAGLLDVILPNASHNQNPEHICLGFSRDQRHRPGPQRLAVA